MNSKIAFRMVAPLVALLPFALGSAACGSEEGVESIPVEQVADGKADSAHGARFETFTGTDGKSYFHLLASNGERVLQSQGYTSKQSAEDGITSVRMNGIETESFTLLQAQNGQWYFNLVATNGKTIGSSELFVSRSNAERAVATVVAVVESANEAAAPSGARFQTFHGLDGQYYFHLRAANGEIVLQSEGYTRSASATAGIASVRGNGGDVHRYLVEYAANGQAYFVLSATNGQIIAVSETYSSRTKAKSAATKVAGLLARATL